MKNLTLLPGEQFTFALRSLYDRHGYTRYRMNKFEEYDLYARNKAFLISENVITFTDMSGKLMALKPDVTLSIVKNTQDAPDALQKLYYNENVYRVAKGSQSFREIPQVGLEAIGDVDDYCILEVLRLAAESLACTNRNCVLEVSHMGILSQVLKYLEIPGSEKETLLHFISEKNLHEMCSLLTRLEIPAEKQEILRKLLTVSGTPDEVLGKLPAILGNSVEQSTVGTFTEILSALPEDAKKLLRIDFSAVSDPRYYNGFVFKGFAEGIPVSILSGGQYDTMMKEMKRKSKAIGFAIYLDLLEQYTRRTEAYDVDVLLLYGENSTLSEVQAQAEAILASGKSVRTAKKIPENLAFQTLLVLKNGTLEETKNA